MNTKNLKKKIIEVVEKDIILKILKKDPNIQVSYKDFLEFMDSILDQIIQEQHKLNPNKSNKKILEELLKGELSL